MVIMAVHIVGIAKNFGFISRAHCGTGNVERQNRSRTSNRYYNSLWFRIA